MSSPEFTVSPPKCSYSAELGDTGERSWWLDLCLPSAEGREKGGWKTHKTPSMGCHTSTSTHNEFKH